MTHPPSENSNPPNPNTRREFLKTGTVAATAGLFVSGSTSAQENNNAMPPATAAKSDTGGPQVSETPKEFQEFSRYKPSYGGPPGSDTYLGKLVPGLRKSGLAPVPFEAPDTPKLPFKIVNGWKEFHLIAEPLTHEFAHGVGADACAPDPGAGAEILLRWLE